MRALLISVILLILFPGLTLAARPLSTDDAGTVEKSHLELESGVEYADKTDDEYNWTTTLKYGLSENLDIGLEIPYRYLEVKGGDDVDGLSDIVLSSKLRILNEAEDSPALAFSFSIKTKTGNEDKGLGTGELDYTFNLIFSKELGKIVNHLNLGYTDVGKPEGQSDDELFSYAAALQYPLTNRLHLVGELSGETNFAGNFDNHPFVVLAGFNYVFSDIGTFDFGVSWGISEASADYTVTSGLTLAY